MINRQHIFHRRYERTVLPRRNNPLLFEMRLKFVFFRTRPIVLSLASMLSSTSLFSSNRSVQRARPSGGCEHASAISLASFAPSKMRGVGGVSLFLRLNTASSPSLTHCRRTRQH